jgi:hypothetical protein
MAFGTLTLTALGKAEVAKLLLKKAGWNVSEPYKFVAEVMSGPAHPVQDGAYAVTAQRNFESLIVFFEDNECSMATFEWQENGCTTTTTKLYVVSVREFLSDFVGK